MHGFRARLPLHAQTRRQSLGKCFRKPYGRTAVRKLSCSLDGVGVESGGERFHLDTLRVAESVPHLGLPIRGPSRRHALRKSKLSPAPNGPIPALLESIMFNEPLSKTSFEVTATNVRFVIWEINTKSLPPDPEIVYFRGPSGPFPPQNLPEKVERLRPPTSGKEVFLIDFLESTCHEHLFRSCPRARRCLRARERRSAPVTWRPSQKLRCLQQAL